jgi:Cobalamin-5-phosphate synthase
MLQLVRDYLLAVQFFTRIPITGRLAEWVGFSPERFRASAAHFPGVGVLVGLVAAGVFIGVQGVVPDSTFTPLLAAALSTVATVLLTGGFHEDGLADVADGLGGSYDRERALEIMKDSRVGAFGARVAGSRRRNVGRLDHRRGAGARACHLTRAAAAADPLAAARRRHRHIQIQATGRHHLVGGASARIYMVFYSASPRFTCADSY